MHMRGGEDSQLSTELQPPEVVRDEEMLVDSMRSQCTLDSFVTALHQWIPADVPAELNLFVAADDPLTVDKVRAQFPGWVSRVPPPPHPSAS